MRDKTMKRLSVLLLLLLLVGCSGTHTIVEGEVVNKEEATKLIPVAKTLIPRRSFELTIKTTEGSTSTFSVSEDTYNEYEIGDWYYE